MSKVWDDSVHMLMFALCQDHIIKIISSSLELSMHKSRENILMAGGPYDKNCGSFKSSLIAIFTGILNNSNLSVPLPLFCNKKKRFLRFVNIFLLSSKKLHISHL